MIDLEKDDNLALTLAVGDILAANIYRIKNNLKMLQYKMLSMLVKSILIIFLQRATKNKLQTFLRLRAITRLLH